jgi:hypothetical protein
VCQCRMLDLCLGRLRDLGVVERGVVVWLKIVGARLVLSRLSVELY